MQGWGWKPPFPTWHRPAARWERRAGGEGGEPSGASFRADLGRREQLPMQPSPTSPPSRRLGLESHRTAPVWLSPSRSCGAGPGPGPLGFEEEHNKEAQKARPRVCSFQT